jgi:hypothetical protein
MTPQVVEAAERQDMQETETETQLPLRAAAEGVKVQEDTQAMEIKAVQLPAHNIQEVLLLPKRMVVAVEVDGMVAVGAHITMYHYIKWVEEEADRDISAARG